MTQATSVRKDHQDPKATLANQASKVPPGPRAILVLPVNKDLRANKVPKDPQAKPDQKATLAHQDLRDQRVHEANLALPDLKGYPAQLDPKAKKAIPDQRVPKAKSDLKAPPDLLNHPTPQASKSYKANELASNSRPKPPGAPS